MSLYPRHKKDCPKNPFMREKLPQPNTMLCECKWTRRQRDKYWNDLLDATYAIPLERRGGQPPSPE